MNTRSVGHGVGCRPVNVGIDLDTLRVNSCFIIGDGKRITTGVETIRDRSEESSVLKNIKSLVLLMSVQILEFML